MMFREGQVCEGGGSVCLLLGGRAREHLARELNEVIEGADAGDQGSN